jgi:anti-sigma regulatory factor (Ser/Thr protein kinase)
MRELSLNVLDIAQNSIAAGATQITICVTLDSAGDCLTIEIDDNGHGMTAEQVNRVSDPFYTTRTTRKVGMGIPLFRMAAELAGGKLDIHSTPQVGTRVTATFGLSHIDRMPLGDMCNTLTALIRMNPSLDFIYRYTIDGRCMEIDTRAWRQILGDVSFDTPEVMEWIDGFIKEQTQHIEHQTMTELP